MDAILQTNANINVTSNEIIDNLFKFTNLNYKNKIISCHAMTRRKYIQSDNLYIPLQNYLNL